MKTGTDRAFLVTGAGGMLGMALRRLLAEQGVRCAALRHADLDITSQAAVEAALWAFAEECGRDGVEGTVVNAAAYTDVERAESEPEVAFAVNETGAVNVARAAAAAGLGIVHVSTDFVFDGTKGAPYVETDETHPPSVYGASKLAGERAVASAHPGALIVRTAWVYGSPGPDFPTKVLERARAAGKLQVVDTEVGCPTYSRDLAVGILGLLDAGAQGLYHLAGKGSCSRYEMALKVVEFAGLDVHVEAVGGSQYPAKAARPADGRLDCTRARLLGVELPPWESSLRGYVCELTVSNG